jgi:hypothetical protein
MPTPDKPHGAPVWENHVEAEAIRACLGLIPPDAVRVSVGVFQRGWEVVLRFTLAEAGERERADLVEATKRLQAALGDEIEVYPELMICPHYSGGGVFDPVFHEHHPIRSVSYRGPLRMFFGEPDRKNPKWVEDELDE